MITTPEQTIRGYTLHEQLGEGGFGCVYRAQQAIVNRDVAIKVIKPDHANDAAFIRTFEYEAQLVARLEHPYIVPLFDYWRDANGAYLVMRYMLGGSLGKRLKRERLSMNEIVTCMDQIGEALAFAHRHNVIHRDLKPDNILLDDEGNAYLSDFGIARASDVPQIDEGLSGTLGYISPDQIKGFTPTPQADIYSLGVILYYLLAGVHPFAGQSASELITSHTHEPLPNICDVCPDLPAAVNDVIQRATAKDPADRYDDAREVGEGLRQALAQDASVALPVFDLETLKHDTTHLANPYKGLKAFQEHDAQDFYGRNALIKQLLARMSEPLPESRLLAVIGPSGSGKSSVVKAGLLPALRAGGIEGSDHWFITEMVPGAQPFQELEAALMRVAFRPMLQMQKYLRADVLGLAHVVKHILPADKTELLLVIDQFEELFTQTTDEKDRAFFLNSLLKALEDPQSRLRMIITLRADFYDKPLQYVEFGTWLKNRIETVLPMTLTELVEAITRPGEQAGAVFEQGLIEAIVQDIDQQPGMLPLLQYALTELFEQREGVVMTLASYRAMGGVIGALAGQAEALYNTLDAKGQATAQQMFLRLVNVEEGSEGTRRRIQQSELGTEAGKAVQLYGEARLLTFDHDPVTRAPTIEVAHEALIRTWTRLQDWINGHRDQLRLHRQLSRAAQEWLNARRDSGFLARDSRLTQFEALVQSNALTLNEAERSFLEASIAARDAYERAETARKAREERTARRAQSLGRMAVAFAVLGIFALVATVVAGFQAQAAANQVVESQMYQSMVNLAVSSHNLLEGSQSNVEVAALLAIRALSYKYIPLADSALVKAVDRLQTQQIFMGHTASIRSVAFSPDGQRVLTASEDQTLCLWDVTTGQLIRTFTGHKGPVTSVVLSQDGRMAVSGSEDGTLLLWNINTPTPIKRFEGHTAGVTSVALSDDGQTALSGSRDGTLRLWDVDTGAELKKFEGYGEMITSVAFSPNEKMILSGSKDKTVRLWDRETTRSLYYYEESDDILSVAFSPDGKTILSGSEDSQVRLWDIASHELIQTFEGHVDGVSAVAFGLDGTVLSSSRDGTLRMWNIASGEVQRIFEGHSGPVYSVAFNQSTQMILSGSEDHSARLWNATSTHNPHVFQEGDVVSSVAFSPDGTQALSGSYDHLVQVWDLASGNIFQPLKGHQGTVTSVVFNADGTQVLSGADDKTMRLWDVKQGSLIQEFEGHDAGIWGVALSHNGAYAVSGSKDKTVKLWDLNSGQVLETFHGHSDDVTTVSFSPDDSMILSGSLDGTLKLWSVMSLSTDALKTFSTVDDAYGNDIWSAAFSPDGKTILGGSQDGNLWLWDIYTGEQISDPWKSGSGIWSVAFSPDGQFIVTASNDGSLTLWDRVSRSPVRVLRGHTYSVWGVAFSPDNLSIVSGSRDGTMRLWNRRYEDLIAYACTHVFRDFTPNERQHFGIPDNKPTCPQLENPAA